MLHVAIPSRFRAFFVLVAACGGDPPKKPSVKEKQTVEILAFQVEPTQLPRDGGRVTLTWKTRNAKAAAIEAEGVRIAQAEPVEEGSLEWEIERTTRFRLIATGEGGTVSRDVVVEVDEVVLPRPPEIGEFFAEPSVVGEGGGTVRLHWRDVRRADALRVEREGGESFHLDSSSSEGSVEVEVDARTTFVLVAENPGGVARKKCTVDVVPLPAITSFRARPARVGAAEPFTLIWRTENAVRVFLETEQGPVPGVEEGMVDHDLAGVRIAADTDFVLRAFNAAGDFVEATLAVPVGAPVIESVRVWPPFVAPGGSAALEWKVLGGTSLRVLDAGGKEVCTVAEVEAIEEGSCEVAAPSEGEHVFRVRVENGAGAAEAEVALLAGVGPYVVSLTANPDRLTVGESVEIPWVVLDDPSGSPTTLTLSDGTNEFDLSDKDPNADSITLVLSEKGTQTFTLTASSAGSRQRSVEVQVGGVPSVVLLASAPLYDGSQPVALLWNSQNADGGLVLYEVRPDGQQAALFEVPEDQRESGSIEVEPERDTTHVLVADNGTNRTARAEVRVMIGPPLVVSFEADPEEIDLGDESFVIAVTEFQVVLWEDGAFAFRYGPSLATDELGTAVMNGYGAVVGYQSPGAEHWLNFHVGSEGPVEGGLTGRSWIFEPPSSLPPSGTHTFRPERSSTITLRATSAKGETVATVDVVVNPPAKVTATANPTSVSIGEPVNLSWSTTARLPGTPTVYLPMREVLSPFVDISTHPDAVQLVEPLVIDAVVWLPFAGGFQFPWGGELHSGVGVSVSGYLTFVTTVRSFYRNRSFPFGVPVAIAPFWDTLFTGPSGGVFALALEDGTHIIQWSGMSCLAGSFGDSVYDLNFQVALLPDGSFEFRYGTMAPPVLTSHPDCIGGDCALEAQGARATIGYQSADWRHGYNLHRGTGAPFPGGLEHRSFRMDGGLSGSLYLYPEETITYAVCAELAGYTDCEAIEVQVTP